MENIMKKYGYLMLIALCLVEIQTYSNVTHATQLQIAIKTSDGSKLKNLYKSNPEIFTATTNFNNMPTVRGFQLNPLMFAVFTKNNNIIPVLLSLPDVKEAINAQDKNGSTALMMATETGNLYAAQQLINAGANPNIANPQVGTPLEKARELKDKKMINILEQAVKKFKS